jgi:hypothetical protein
MRPRDKNGKKYPFDGAGVGTLVKFPRTGGKIYSKGAGLSMDRPAEFAYGITGNALYWSQNLLWRHDGVGFMPYPGSCTCPHCRIDLDVYGRVFAPERWRHSVAILDGNGNLILRCGTYGNADEALAPGRRSTAVADCSFVGVDSDRWLYMTDIGHYCITRVKLGYKAEKRTPLTK